MTERPLFTLFRLFVDVSSGILRSLGKKSSLSVLTQPSIEGRKFKVQSISFEVSILDTALIDSTAGLVSLFYLGKRIGEFIEGN